MWFGNLGPSLKYFDFSQSRKVSQMARKPKLEAEGGLYHVVTRGNNRRRIFGDEDDDEKMLKLIGDTKRKLPFFYAYCLMPNHFHLLVERRQEAISRIMHRVLNGCSRYYNRRNGRVGYL
jgi:REP-associated tyrosine transposase